MVRIQIAESEPPRLETKTCVHCRSKKQTENNEVDMSQYNDLRNQNDDLRDQNDDLRSRYDDLLGEFKKSMNEVAELRIQLHSLSPRVPQELREKNALLQKENDELRSRISQMEAEQESLRQRCTPPEEVNPQLRTHVAQVPHQIDESANIARLEKPNLARVGTGQLRRRSRGNPVEELIHRTQIYLDPTIGEQAKENNLLATQILHMTNLNPKYTESYYSDRFNEINNDIEKWVVGQVDNTPSGTLLKVYTKEKTRYTLLVSKVKALDENAGKVLEILKPQVLSDPENRRRYIALSRHVIAVFLYSQIFRLFMFGLDRRESDGLNRVEHEICTNG